MCRPAYHAAFTVSSAAWRFNLLITDTSAVRAQPKQCWQVPRKPAFFPTHPHDLMIRRRPRPSEALSTFCSSWPQPPACWPLRCAALGWGGGAGSCQGAARDVSGRGQWRPAALTHLSLAQLGYRGTVSFAVNRSFVASHCAAHQLRPAARGVGLAPGAGPGLRPRPAARAGRPAAAR